MSTLKDHFGRSGPTRVVECPEFADEAGKPLQVTIASLTTRQLAEIAELEEKPGTRALAKTVQYGCRNGDDAPLFSQGDDDFEKIMDFPASVVLRLSEAIGNLSKTSAAIEDAKKNSENNPSSTSLVN